MPVRDYGRLLLSNVNVTENRSFLFVSEPLKNDIAVSEQFRQIRGKCAAQSRIISYILSIILSESFNILRLSCIFCSEKSIKFSYKNFLIIFTRGHRYVNFFCISTKDCIDDLY